MNKDSSRVCGKAEHSAQCCAVQNLSTCQETCMRLSQGSTPALAPLPQALQAATMPQQGTPPSGASSRNHATTRQATWLFRAIAASMTNRMPGIALVTCLRAALPRKDALARRQRNSLKPFKFLRQQRKPRMSVKKRRLNGGWGPTLVTPTDEPCGRYMYVAG